MPRNPALLTLAAICLLAVLLLVPVPFTGRAVSSLMDLLHAPAFAGLAFLVCRARFRQLPQSLVGQLICIALPLAFLGALAELAQAFVGRGTSWHDAFANLLGSVTGVCLYQAACGSASISTSTTELPADAAAPQQGRKALVCLAGFLLLSAEWSPACTVYDSVRQLSEFPVLATFSSSLEVGRFESEDARLSRVPDPENPDRWLLAVALQPGEFPGVKLIGAPPNWSAYETLVVELIVDPGKPLDLILKVHDREHWAHDLAGDDRFDGLFHLLPGSHVLRIPLAKIQAAPRTRLMDLTQIDGCQLFTYELAHPRTIWLAGLRLE